MAACVSSVRAAWPPSCCGIKAGEGPKSKGAIAEGQTREIALQRPVPLWVLYLTAFVEARGAVQFREDVYGFDARGRIFEELATERVETASDSAPGCRG